MVRGARTSRIYPMGLQPVQWNEKIVGRIARVRILRPCQHHQQADEGAGPRSVGADLTLTSSFPERRLTGQSLPGLPQYREVLLRLHRSHSAP